MGELQQILPAMQADYPCARLSDHVKLIYQNEFGWPKAAHRRRICAGRLRPPAAAAACLNPSATATGAST